MFKNLIRDISGRETDTTIIDKARRKRATDCFKRACDDLTTAMSKSTVLLVDDNPIDAMTLLRMLKDVTPAGGPAIVTVSSAEDAITFIEEHGEDVRVVVTDMYMHDDPQSGMKLVEWVKKHHSTIPILVCTAFTDLVKELRDRYPDVQVLLKGEFSTPQLLLLLGMQPAGYEAV